MPVFPDARGLAVTAASPEAVAHLDRSTDGFLAFDKETGDRLKPALAADPDCAMAHVQRGYYMLLMADRNLVPRAAKSAAAAEAAAPAATSREQAHAAALHQWAAGRFADAVTRWEAILVDHPLDVMALRLANLGHFYAGDGKAMRDSLGRCLHAWDAGVPGYGYILGSYAFALEESGDYPAAERVGRQAIDINPADIWATHAVAHVMEMQERPQEGIDWITALDRNFAHCHNFTYHLWWHRALFHWDMGRYDEALALYDREVRPESTEDALDFSNAAALLWRLEHVGVDVGARWDELTSRALARIDDHMLVFNDAHFAMAIARADEATRARYLASCRAYAVGRESQAGIMADCGLAIVEGVLAFRQGDFAAAADRLAVARPMLHRIGGSHAQRDVFDQIAAVAALRAGQWARARALWSERVHRRPGCGWSRARYAEAMAGPAA
ncbi:MAG: tetratricopeptide repeat protein [Alphaproteobacteria bacterium]